MKKGGLIIILLILVLGCQTSPNQSSIVDFIPEQTDLVIEIKNFERFKSALRNNPIVSKTSLEEVIEDRWGTLDSMNISGPLLICANLDHEKPKYTFITQQKHIDQSLLTKIKPQIKDSILVVSEQNEAPVKPSNIKHPYTSIRPLADSKSTLSLYYSSNKSSVWNNVFLNVKASPESLALNGILLEESLGSIAGLLEAGNNQPQRISVLAPENIISTESYTNSDFNGFFNALNTQDSTKVVTNLSQSFFGTINEMGWIETPKGRGFVGHSIDLEATKNVLIGYQSIAENFRSVPIFEFNEVEFLNNIPGRIKAEHSPNRYTIIDDFIIFSNKDDFLKEIISNYQNKNTLENNDSYNRLIAQLSDNITFQKTLNSEGLSLLLNSILKTDFETSDLLAYNYSTYQLIRDDHVIHLNAQIQKDKPKVNAKKIREEFSLTLDADIMSEVQFVNNHSNAQKDLVVQDIENQLYLISNQGIVQWKKKLPGPILGRIQQVDLFKNGKLQLAFSTSNRVYILDRLGRDVGAFPLKFNDAMSQPLAIFDYDNRQDYRFLVTQKNTLLMYDSRGKRVKGFKYKPKSEIASIPKHFRYRGKDYIVFKAGKKLQILDRRGQVRVAVEESIDFSNQDIYFYKNQWTTLDNKGDVVQIDTKGRVSRQTKGFSSTTKLTTSSKTLVAQWDNYLQIKDQKFTLNFGQKTPPKLFYLNDKIYIAITDIDSNSIWFYDSEGHSFTGFPVFGTSTIDLNNADADEALEFVGQSGPDNIIMYQLY